MFLNYLKNKTFEIVFALALLFLVVYGLRCWWKPNGSGSYSTKKIWDRIVLPGDLLPERDKKMEEFKKAPKDDSLGESKCRQVIERIFNQDFKKARPDFLKNSVTGSNQNLELDCYNEKLKIAIEYQGRQHYEYVPFFHNNSKAVFENGKYRDEFKRRMCKEKDILLIEVPYTVEIDDIEQFIKTELKAKYK